MKVLSPLVRLLLRHGVAHAEFSDWARQVYVREAFAHFGIDGKPPTISRMAIVTGINRKEVKRIQALPATVETGVGKHNRAMRVVTGWLQDREFQDRDGQPLPLRYGESEDGFNRLVRRHGGDVPARALLDELERVGTVAVEQGTVTLLHKGYVPHQSESAMLDVFATSASDLLTTLDHNLHTTQGRRLQMSVVYDEVTQAGREHFRRISAEQGVALLRAMDAELSAYDTGRHPELEQPGSYRVGLGLYWIEDIDSHAAPRDTSPKEDDRDESAGPH